MHNHDLSKDQLVEELARLQQRVAELERAECEWQRTGEALRASEEHLYLLTSGSPDTMFHQDRDLRYTWVANPSPGLVTEGVLGKTDWDLFPSNEAEHLVGLKQEVMQTGESRRVEVPVTTGGVTRWYEAAYQPWRDGEGQVAGVACYAREITERKKTEDQLRYQAALLANVNDAIVASDAQYRLTAWNSAAEALYGWKAEEVLGKDGLEIVQTEFEGVDKSEVLRRIREQGGWRGEVTQARKDGTRVAVEVSSMVLREASGQVTGYVSVNRDITGRKQMEEALRESEQRYRELVECLQEGVWAIDRQSHTTFVNPRMAEMLGYSVEEMLGRHLFEFMDERGVEIGQRNLERRRQGIKEQHEFEFLRKDGTRIYTNLETTPLLDAQGNYNGALAAVSDISERKQAEETLTAYRQIVSSTPDGIALLDQHYRYQIVNDTYEMFSARKREQLLGLSVAEYLGEEVFNTQIKAQFDRCLAGETVKLQGWFDYPTLGLRYVEVTYFPYVDVSGQIAGVVANTRDVTEARRAEEALRESEEQRRHAQRLTRVGYWDWSVATNELLWSPEVFDIFGQDPQTFRPSVESFEASIHPDDLQRFVAERNRALADPAADSLDIEHRIVWPDGTIHHVHEICEIWRDERGAVSQVEGAVQDISERKRTEEALRESEEKFALAFRTSPYAITITRARDGTFIEVNDAFASITGYTREEASANSSLGLRLWVDEEDRRRVVSALFEGKNITGREFAFRRKDGSVMTGLFSAQVIHLRDEPCILSSINDITERKQAEEALRESEQRYRLIADNTSDSIWAMGSDLHFTYLSPSTERLFGYTLQEWQTLDWGVFVCPDYVGMVMSLFDDLQCGQKTRSDPVAVRVRHKDGRELWVEFTMAPIRSPDGVLTQIVGVSRDITERKRAEQALHRSNADLQHFAYAVSHDLQEPLRMVSSYVQLLQKRYAGRLDPDADEFIGYAVEGAQRMSAMIHGILDYSRVDSQGQAMAPTDCQALLQRALVPHQLTIEDSGAAVTHDPLPTVQADATQLGRVFQNLLSNALKFCGEAPPKVHVSARQTDGVWVFSVQDNGIGIDPQYAGQLFQVFRRLHSRAEYPGTGIGLALCKRIVERHGGRIWVDSQPGEGATFYFTLPVQGE